jgi:hypothetical protein
MYSVQYPTGDAKAGADVSDRHPPKRFWILAVLLPLVGVTGIEFTLIQPVQAASNKIIQYQIQRKQQQRFQQQFGRPPIRSNPSGQKPRYMQQFGRPAKTAPTTLPRPAPTKQQQNLSNWYRDQLQKCKAACPSPVCPFGSEPTCLSTSGNVWGACVQGCVSRYGGH